ncbi:MAG: tetratricopeptide repeat protein [Bacteroidales bacterium]
MIFRGVSILILFYAVTVFCFSQTQEIDSLKSILDTSEEDSTKVNTLIELSKKFYRAAQEEDLSYATEALDLAKKIKFKTGLAYAYKSIGLAYYFRSKFLEAAKNWELSLVIFREINDKNGISNMLNNLGAVYFNEGEDVKALDYYLESLKVAEEINDTLRIATALINIGAIYSGKEASHDLAIKYYKRSIILSEILGDYDAIGASYVNMGGIYLSEENDSLALVYFEESLNAYRKSSTEMSLMH